MPNIVFLHGLESGPGGHKPTVLKQKHTVTAPELPTREAMAHLSRELSALPAEIAAAPLRVAAEAVAAAKPDVVVGSSFGGGIAAALSGWGGPLVLMAPAAEKLFRVTSLPKRPGRVVVIHGRRDDIVPCDDSVRLAAQSECDVALWLVDDDHRLKASVDAGLMEEAIAWVLAGPPTTPRP